MARGKEFSQSYEWEQCDPHGLNTHLDNLFEGTKGNQLRRIVRYLKKWKLENFGESYSKDQLPPSIALTLMAGDVFIYQTKDGQDDDLAALDTVVKGIKNMFSYDLYTGKQTISYSLPVRPWTNVFYKMNADYQDKFYKKWCTLCTKVQNAADASEEYEAAKFLRDVFGEDFELPEKPQAKTGTPKKEYSYA